MKTFEIFSQLIWVGSSTESIFVRLSCNQDIGLKSITAESMEIVESFSIASPAVSFEFTDGNGDFVNHIKPNPSTTFYLDIGRSIIDTTRISLKCVKLVMLNKKAGSAEQIAFKMFFAHESWDTMTSIRRNRGWANTKHTDIVREIVADAGYDLTDIADGSSREEYTIQPYWDNIKMIRYLQMSNRSPNGGHTEFGMRLNGEFVFKTTGDMIVEQRTAALNRELPIIRLEGQIDDEATRKTAYDNNYGVPTYFAHFSASERYMDAVRNGGGGYKAMQYDSINDVLKVRDVKYSTSQTLQLSDWAAVQNVHETSNIMWYGGRDASVFDDALNDVVDIVDSMNTFEISMDGAVDLHIGRMIELIIPVPINIGSLIPSNLLYSGFYLVSGVQHKIRFSSGRVGTQVFLMREGFDTKNLDGYIKSLKGKFV